MSESSLLTVSKRHMATDFHFEVVVPPGRMRAADSVLEEAHDWVESVEAEISEFRETSPVRLFNRSLPGAWIDCPTHFEALLNIAQRMEVESSGYYSPFSKSKGCLSFDDLEREGARIRKRNPEMQLGFGAIGKGYAIDGVRTLIEREGFTDYRLNCGGSSWILRGANANGLPWELSWAWDRDEDGDWIGQEFALRPDESIAIGVSGIVEQGNHFRFRGQAVPEGVRSGFYAGRSAAEADALSTALVVGAAIEGAGILTKISNPIRNPSLAYVDLTNQIVYNRGFDIRFRSSPIAR